MFARNPNTGAPITGTKEVLTAQARITPGTFAHAKAGQVVFEYESDTEVYWDDQRTEMSGGERIFIDEYGHEVAESALVLVEEDDKGSRASARAKRDGATTFEPKMDFADASAVPRDMARRVLFIDAVAQTIIPEEVEADNDFKKEGRTTLVGLAHFLIAAVNDRTDADAPCDTRGGGLPQRWKRRDASVAMLVDWVLEREAQAKPDGRSKKWLAELVAEATENSYPRCIPTLQRLMGMTREARNGVLATMTEAVRKFREEMP